MISRNSYTEMSFSLFFEGKEKLDLVAAFLTVASMALLSNSYFFVEAFLRLFLVTVAGGIMVAMLRLETCLVGDGFSATAALFLVDDFLAGDFLAAAVCFEFIALLSSDDFLSTALLVVIVFLFGLTIEGGGGVFLISSSSSAFRCKICSFVKLRHTSLFVQAR